jgi:pyruvate dehydrogenase E2 component (dihydrolipoamide acetyltransferase)
MKKDIQSYSPFSRPQDPIPPSGSSQERVRTESLSTIRKTIAKNMIRSKHNAIHMSIMDEVEVSSLVSARKRLNEVLQDQGVKLTYLPFVIKAVALALKHHPVLNAELDMEQERIIYKYYYNIGIAMDAEEGLIVPVIRDADRKTLFEIAQELSDLTKRVKERKINLDDLKDGTFSITSYGSIGGYFAVPVIAYPQVGIFGVGRLTEKPIAKDGQIVIGNLLPISMSVDHRIVDGGEVTRFLNEVLGYLKEPLLLLALTGGNHEV